MKTTHKNNGSRELSGLFSRIAKSRSGNTVVILAAALVPLGAFVGAGFDMSRSYLVKSRLQTACDSGALAARRAMVGAAWGPTSQSAGNSYFDANFQTGRYGTTGLTRSFASADGETVRGIASVDVPTTIMKMFGNDVVNVDVDCQAIMNLPNTDVMFVLDTTGSMNEVNPGDSASRIDSLRDAVKDFHSTIEAAKSAGTQVRYGFVPYSTNVNVGHLLKRDWMVNRWTYQSRAPEAASSSSTGMSVTNSNWRAISGTRNVVDSFLPRESCNPPPDNATYTNETVTSSTSTPYAGPPAGTQTVRTINITINGTRYWVNRTSTTCTLSTETTVDYVEERTETSRPVSGTTGNWNYAPIEYDVSSLKGSSSDGLMAGGSITALTGNDFTSETSPWNGCIEERDTVRTTDYSPIPAGALDLDIDAVPDPANPSTQWRPSIPGLIYTRRWPTDWSYAPVVTTEEYPRYIDWREASCPARANKLEPMTNGEVTSYLNTLTPDGNTYHDIGMIWGLRLLSPTGLFASENATTPAGKEIVRHLIFMTDGQTMTNVENYDAYGFSALDRRRTNVASLPTNAETNALVEARLAALCELAKGRNITVWVIAFGTSLTPLLEDCASDASAFEADNAAALNTTFAEIASKIANLRLND